MTIEGYFDGTAVKPIEKVNWQQNQKVFITLVDDELQKKLDALNDSFGILTEEEGKLLDESISRGIKFLSVQQL